MELDEADMQILRALQEDARRSIRDLAKIADVSAPTASSKVKALESKGVVRRYEAALAPEALGEQVLVVEARARPSEVEGVARKLSALPEVRACHVVGTGRVLAFATLIDLGLQNEFLARLAAIPDVAELEVAPLLKTMKELPQAIVDRGVMLAVKCEFCGRRTKDEVLRAKVGAITHFVCCDSCRKGYLERVERLAKLAGKGKVRSDLKLAEH
jgi:DNA-binding Lrp family transcriptional regulator